MGGLQKKEEGIEKNLTSAFQNAMTPTNGQVTLQLHGSSTVRPFSLGQPGWGFAYPPPPCVNIALFVPSKLMLYSPHWEA